MEERTAEDIERYQLILDVRYGMRVGLMHRRLYVRMNAALTIASLIGGTSAFAGFIGDSANVTGWAALALTVCAVIAHVVNPAVQALKAEQGREAFAELNRLAPTLTTKQLRDRLHGVLELELPDIEALRIPARNDMLRENGREDCVTAESAWSRFVATFA